LVYFITIWHILSWFGTFLVHGFGTMYQEKSGNPGPWLKYNQMFDDFFLDLLLRIVAQFTHSANTYIGGSSNTSDPLHTRAPLHSLAVIGSMISGKFWPQRSKII
jgi:hypothetical protein